MPKNSEHVKSNFLPPLWGRADSFSPSPLWRRADSFSPSPLVEEGWGFFSLPPCGGGLGWGVGTPRPPTLTLPHQGGGKRSDTPTRREEMRGSVNPIYTPLTLSPPLLHPQA